MWMMLRVVGMLIALVGIAKADDGNLISPDGVALRLAPGESGTLRLRVQGVHMLQGWLTFQSGAVGEYSAATAAAGCPALEPMNGNRPVVFDLTQAAGDLLCEYAITRNVASTNDLSMYASLTNAGIPYITVNLRLGVVPTLVLSTRQEFAELLPDGRARGRVRIFLSSESTRDISVLSIGSCLAGGAPFSIDGAIDGGCGDMTHYAGSCFTGGDYGFMRAPVPAHSASSCLVELTTYQPYAVPVSFPIDIVTDYVQDAASGGVLLPLLPSTPRTLGLSVDQVFANGLD